jgi:hypothetical protein
MRGSKRGTDHRGGAEHSNDLSHHLIPLLSDAARRAAIFPPNQVRTLPEDDAVVRRFFARRFLGDLDAAKIYPDDRRNLAPPPMRVHRRDDGRSLNDDIGRQ